MIVLFIKIKVHDKPPSIYISFTNLNEKLGNITYYDSSGQSDYNFSKPYSEETAQVIDKEISAIIEEQYQRALQILSDNKEKLVKLADKLLTAEVLFKEDLEEIFGKRPFEAEGTELLAEELSLKQTQLLENPETENKEIES